MECLVLLFWWGYNWFPYYPVNWENIQNRWVCGLDELAGNSSGSYLYIKPTLDVIWVDPQLALLRRLPTFIQTD